jgi:site-specific DNA recombinase
LSSTSSIRFDNSRAFLRRADQPSLHHTRSQKTADQLQDALVSYPLGNEPHQDVVVNPVEELLQVDIHDDGVSGHNIRLRPLHRLMRRALRPEAEARLGERRVPIGLQHLHHRLLDQAVEHGRHSPIELHCSPVSLWDRLKSPIPFIRFAVIALLS